MSLLKISGRVVDVITQTGIEWLKVEAWKKGTNSAELIVSVYTNSNGEFNVVFDSSNTDANSLGSLNVFYRVYEEGKLLTSTDTSLAHITRYSREPIIEVRRTPLNSLYPLIRINSFTELQNGKMEIELIQRINTINNGTRLYFINPIRLLAEVGIELSDDAKAEVVKYFGSSFEGVSTAYNALRLSSAPQHVTVTIHPTSKN